MSKNALESHFFRHGQAEYKTLGEMRKTDPTGKVRAEYQIYPDLTEEGAKQAREQAKEFLNDLDPEQDLLMFFSSTETRAIQTAEIYREEAKASGFDIIRHEKTGKGMTDTIGEGQIRSLRTLSPKIDNLLIHSLFNPNSMIEDINWTKVDPALKDRWDQARRIINKSIQSGDHGDTWRENFLAHAEEVKDFFPEITSAKDRFDTLFQYMLKLIYFASRKTKENTPDKKLQILGFGHEDTVLYALQKHFEVDEIDNCEHVSFIQDDNDNINMYWKGEESSL